MTTNSQGRFQTDRALEKAVLLDKSPDGSLGAVVKIGPDDPQVVLTLIPTVRAIGLLLDEQGKAAAKQELDSGRPIYEDEKQRRRCRCSPRKS